MAFHELYGLDFVFDISPHTGNYYGNLFITEPSFNRHQDGQFLEVDTVLITPEKHSSLQSSTPIYEDESPTKVPLYKLTIWQELCLTTLVLNLSNPNKTNEFKVKKCYCVNRALEHYHCLSPKLLLSKDIKAIPRLPFKLEN